MKSLKTVTAKLWTARSWTLGLAALFSICVMAHKKVDYPLIETTNTHTIDIACVELTDTATIIRTDAYYHPHNWIRISSESYLQANGKKYKLTGAEGIMPDSLFWMPDSGKAHFNLYFEPLPDGTQSFDFIESDCENCFKLYGIDLTGRQNFETPEGVPSELLKVDKNTSVPDPILKVGKTTLRIHFLHYRPELGESVNLYVNTLFGEQQPYENIAIDPKTATATLSFLQYGTAQLSMAWEGLSGIGCSYLAPGEETDIYVDLRLSGYFLLQRRHEEGKIRQPAPYQYVYTSGPYTHLNAVANMLGFRPSFQLRLFTSDFADYRMTSPEYAAHIGRIYKTLTDSISRSELSPLEKEWAQLTLEGQALFAMAQGDLMRLYNYRAEHGSWDISNAKFDPLKPEDAKSICTLFDINDPKILMGQDGFLYAARALCDDRNFDWPALAGVKSGLVKDLHEVSGFTQKAANIALTDSDFARLKAMDNPFYLEVFTRIQNEVKAKLATTGKNARIMDIPDVPNEQLFDSLVAPHKGKVVLVDFWNTWCGPCRAAIKANEPLKSGELKNDNLVWLYIADESSPIVTYKTMIPDIQGLHYRLNQAQWDYLCNKFQIDGIPSYVLVDKTGKYGLRNDFRDHELMKQVLKKELEK